MIPQEVLDRLRPFQAEDLPFLMKTRKGGLWYEPRLGKTVMGCHVAMLDEAIDRIIVDCPKNAIPVWQDHIKKWGKTLNCKVRIITISQKYTNPEKRKELWSIPIADGVKVFYLIVHGSFIKDSEWLLKTKFRCNMFIFDEYHKYMKSRTTKSFDILKKFLSTVPRFLPLSGTPIDKNIQEFFPVLHLCNPRVFSSYWGFVNNWCETLEGMWGKEIIGPKSIQNWQKQLSYYGRRRERKVCAPWMPEVEREQIFVEMSFEQSQIYDQLRSDGFIWNEESGKIIVASTSIEKTIRFRQMLICPKILDPAYGYGSALEHLGDVVEEADENECLVVFTPFVRAIHFILEYLTGRGAKGLTSLQGGVEANDLRSRILKYRREKGIMVCSTHFAQAFSLEPAQRCFHLGYDWTPNVNKQAEDRLVPQQGTNPILSSYYTYYNSVDEEIAQVVIQKNETVTASLRDHSRIEGNYDNP